jgi:HAD superfamily hydrolase (TIGR01509 family)
MSTVKAALCDLDGTLVDSNALHAEAWRRTFEHFGIAVSFDEALHQIGKGGDQLIPVFVPKKDIGSLQKPIEEYRKELFQREYFSRVKAFPGSRDLLVKMKEAGLRVAVASSASKQDLARLKKIAGIEDIVEEETSSDDAENSKPFPDIFEAALKRLGLEASETLALGDTPWDIESARNAGLSTVAVTSGGWTRDELREAGAIEIYRDIAELAANFASSAFCRV